MNRIVALSAFFLAVTVMGSPYAFAAPAPAPMPIAALQSLKPLKEGQELRIDPETKKVLVVFWATWCPDCKEKLQTLPTWMKDSAQLAILAIGTDKERDRITHFVEKEKVTLPVFLDEDKSVRKELKIFSVPAWAVYRLNAVDKTWKVADSAQGFDEERVRKALQ